MSKGNDRYTVRIGPELITEMEEVIARTHLTRNDQPWTSSDFIRVAIREKLDKMERGRKPYGLRKKTDVPAKNPPTPLDQGVRLDVDLDDDDDTRDDLEQQFEDSQAALQIEEPHDQPPPVKSETELWNEQLNGLRKAARGE